MRDDVATFIAVIVLGFMWLAGIVLAIGAVLWMVKALFF